MTGAKNDLKDDESHTNVVATRRGIIVGAVVLLGLHVITAPVKLGLVMSAKRVAFFSNTGLIMHVKLSYTFGLKS